MGVLGEVFLALVQLGRVCLLFIDKSLVEEIHDIYNVIMSFDIFWSYFMHIFGVPAAAAGTSAIDIIDRAFMSYSS